MLFQNLPWVREYVRPHEEIQSKGKMSKMGVYIFTVSDTRNLHLIN